MRKPTSMIAFGHQIRRNEGNCFVWGCASLALVLILGGIVAFFSIRYGIQQLREQYTDDVAVELPVVEMPQEAVDTLIERVDTFSDGLREGEPVEQLVLTQDELNALFQHHPDLAEMAGRIYVTIDEDDTVNGQVSVPLDFLPGFGGRYFNGSASFDVAIENGEFTVFVNSATLKGEPVPDAFMEGIRGQNLAQEMQTNNEAGELFDKVEKLEVKDGLIWITPVKLKEAGVEGPEAEVSAEGPA